MARKQNKFIKPANHEEEYTYEQILELKRCTQDPVYFITNYVQIEHPIRGAIPFELYPYQEKMVQAYHENRYVVVLSARQTGKSISSAAFLLWYAMFNFNKTILIASNKNTNAMEMIKRVRYAYEHLPWWLKPGVKDDAYSKHEIGFDNDSRIISTATSETSGRGFSISLLYLDEFAFVKPNIQDEFWTSISPTLATGGACIMTSTPNGDRNIFAQIWRGAQVNANGFKPLRVYWDEPPGRNEKWKKEEIGRVGERKWQQEYLCEFLSSDALLIDSLVLSQLTKPVESESVQFTIKDVEFYEPIRPENTYLVGVDPATGTGEDFSVIEIYHFPSMRHVAEYRSNTMSQSKVYEILKNIIKYIEKTQATCYFSVENNGVGQGIIALFEADNEPPLMSEFISEEGRDKKGMVTTAKTKMRACVNLKEMLERGRIQIRSSILLGELKSFVIKKGSYGAQTGSTDDCVSAVLIVLRMLEEIATYEQEAYDQLYSYVYHDWPDDNIGESKDEYDEDDLPLPFIV